MNLQEGDCILLRTCPDDPACYFIGPIKKIDGIPFEEMGIIDVISTNCLSNHYTSKKERAFHPDQVVNGKVILWL